MLNTAKIPLADLPRRLKAEYGRGTPYQRLYLKVIAGELPAERSDTGRWLVDEADLPAIAEALGVAQAAGQHKAGGGRG